MGNKKLGNLLDGFTVSLSINIIAVIVIIFLWLRKRLISGKKQQIATIITNSPSPNKYQVDQNLEISSKNISELKINTIQTQTTDKLSVNRIDKYIFQVHRATQTIELQSPYEQIRLLKQQLDIERDRSIILEQNHLKLESILGNIKSQRGKSIIKQAQDLKNQLQFCQNMLEQVMRSQRQLKKKLQEYQRRYASIFDHPQYQKLREVNNKYKEIIFRQQTYLLLGREQQNQQDQLDISFHNI